MKNIHRLLIGTSIACFCGVYSGYAEDNHDHDHDHDHHSCLLYTSDAADEG